MALINLTKERSRIRHRFARLVLSIAMGISGIAAAEEADPGSQDFGGLPPGAGQAEVYGLCSSCHSLMIVKQQRLSKEAWLDTLDWMIAEQGMPRLPPESLDLIASYLAEHYGSGGE